VARRNTITVNEGRQAWIMTYGDMMSLLLTFFVLLVSFSSLQDRKFHQATRSLQDAFGAQGDREAAAGTDDPLVSYLRSVTKDPEFLQEVRSMEQAILDQDLAGEVEVRLLDEGVLIELPAPLLFPSGGAKIKSKAEPILEQLARMFRKFPGDIQVEGHTDNVPINSRRFPSNWELSAARAVAVARNFHGLDIPPTRLSATGYGEFRPVADNETAAGRAANRRVEITLALRSDAPPRQDSLPLEPVSAVSPVAGPAGGNTAGRPTARAAKDPSEEQESGN